MRFLTPIVVVLLVASVIANGVMYAKFRSGRPIFTINGQSITKKDMSDYLEHNYSPQYKALQAQRILISQAAKEKKLTATKAEVDARYEERKDIDWQFAQRIRSSPWVADESKDEFQMNIELGRLLIDKAQPGQEEVTEEYARNAALYDTPNRARVELAILTKEDHINDIKQLMLKDNPLIKPTVIMQNYPGEVSFLGGDNFQFTFAQHFGTPENAQIFTMKPGEVKQLRPDPTLGRMGAKWMLVRMIKIDPGHKNDPVKDPATAEKVKVSLAARRANAQTLLQDLWDKASKVSEDPKDMKYIEMTLFPNRGKE